MPMPSEMGVAMTAAEKTGVLDDLRNTLTVLNTIKVVQLTAEERQAARSISNERYPYVSALFDDLIDAYPNLQPPFLDLAKAKNDYQSTQDMRAIISVINEVTDRYTDFSLASENYAFKYLLEVYNIAQRAQGTNNPGADTVVATLQPLFDGMGPQEDAPVTP